MYNLTPYQLEVANNWLKTHPGRFRTKRLRKKFYKNAHRYVDINTFNKALQWIYSKEEMSSLIPRVNFYKLIPASY